MEINNKFNIGSEIYFFNIFESFPDIKIGVIKEITIFKNYNDELEFNYKISYKWLGYDKVIYLTENFIFNTFDDAKKECDKYFEQ